MGIRLFFPGVALAALALVGCAKPPAAPPPPPPMPVTVSKPVSRQIVDYDEYTARLSAVSSVEIRARVSGYLDKVNFRDGAEVKKGDLLFSIDPRPYQAELDRAQADLDKANSSLALASNDATRAQGLMQNKAISAEELDTRSKTSVQAQSSVKSAQAMLEVAQLNMTFTKVTAPIDGQISRTLITEGNLVTADVTPLTTLVSVDPVYAYADIDEAAVIKYQNLDKQGLRKSARNGQIPATLAVGDSPDFNHTGVIDFVDNRIDSTTGTLRARGVFPNPDRTLIPGQYARVRVTGSGRYLGMLIPDSAVGVDQQKKIVTVVGPDKKIFVKEVLLGPLVDGLRVVKSGVEADDLIVLDHLQMVRPGMTVAPNEQQVKDDSADASPADPAHP